MGDFPVAGALPTLRIEQVDTGTAIRSLVHERYQIVGNGHAFLTQLLSLGSAGKTYARLETAFIVENLHNRRGVDYEEEPANWGH